MDNPRFGSLMVELGDEASEMEEGENQNERPNSYEEKQGSHHSRRENQPQGQHGSQDHRAPHGRGAKQTGQPKGFITKARKKRR
jgi:hypothetical protein